MNDRKYRLAIKRYIVGGIGALGWTLVTYGLAVSGLVQDKPQLIFYILVAAMLQLIVQIFYFLHISDESKPRWRQTSFLFTLLMVLVIVIGSIWIMINMNYNMGMSGEDMNTYMIEQNKKGF